jgi:hypothetical protein
MWHTIPVKNLLFLLGADAVILVQKIQEGAFGLFE